MAKAVSERNEVECSFDSGKRIYRANNIRAKRPETARCWTGMCYFVKNVMKFLRELCLCIRQSLRFLCSIWRITHSYEFYSNCVWNFFQRTLIKNQKHTKCARLIYFNARPVKYNHLMQKVVLTILSCIYTHTYADFQYNTFISVECRQNIKKHFWRKRMHYSITITPTFVIYYTD